jgi:hypothetical protein
MMRLNYQNKQNHRSSEQTYATKSQRNEGKQGKDEEQLSSSTGVVTAIDSRINVSTPVQMIRDLRKVKRTPDRESNCPNKHK